MDNGQSQAISGIVAVAGQQIDEAGAIVLWRLSGAVDSDALSKAWAAAGLHENMLPVPPSPKTALLRAMNEQREARRLVRPLEGREGYAIVDEHARGADLDWQVTCRASLDAVGRIKVEADNDSPATQALADEVRRAYDRHLLRELSTTDVSGWLAGRLMRIADGVSLRDGGAVYFIPKHALDGWRQMIGAIRQVSAHAFFHIPALRTDEATEAILDAIASEAQAEADSFQAVLVEGKVGGRALRSKAAQCEATERKVTRYEELLGKALPELQSRLEALRANLAVAAIKADEGVDYTGLASLANL